MPDSELNPQHPVTKGLSQHWHKILAPHMKKLGVNKITLTDKDFEMPPEGLNVVAHEDGEGLHIRLVDNKTAHLLAHS